MEVGEKGYYDSCIKMGSDESRFTVTLIARDKVTRQCPQTITFSEEKGKAKTESSRCSSVSQPNSLPLGQTDSLLPACQRH